MKNKSNIWTNIKYKKYGKQMGSLFIPYSSNRYASGNISIPICVISNGNGLQLLLTAGNHGDEFEGQIVLSKLINKINHHNIKGSIILIPTLNSPACMEGKRLSPIDNLNLNRVFPGLSNGTPTQQIAYYIYNILLPKVDIIFDIHSGGDTLAFIPYCSGIIRGDKAKDKLTMDILKHFGAKYSLIKPFDKNDLGTERAAIDNDIIRIGGEFGGSGQVTTDTLGLLEYGIMRILKYLGILKTKKKLDKFYYDTDFIEYNKNKNQLYSDEYGVFEPFYNLGEKIKKYDVAGQIHYLDNLNKKMKKILFKEKGILIAKKNKPLVEPGDILFKTAKRIKWKKLIT